MEIALNSLLQTYSLSLCCYSGLWVPECPLPVLWEVCPNKLHCHAVQQLNTHIKGWYMCVCMHQITWCSFVQGHLILCYFSITSHMSHMTTGQNKTSHWMCSGRKKGFRCSWCSSTRMCDIQAINERIKSKSITYIISAFVFKWMVCRGRANLSNQSDDEMITFLTQVSRFYSVVNQPQADIEANRIQNSQLRCVLEYV